MPTKGKAQDVRPGRSQGIAQASEKPSPSPSKRQKISGEHRPGPSTPQKQRDKEPDNMYKFESKIIDLTSPSSNHGSPSRRRVSNGIRATNASANAGPKKLVVKNFRTTPKSDPEQYLNSTWKELEEALKVIFSTDVKPFSMEHLYRGVENICRQDKAAKLFRNLQSKCEEHVKDVRDTLKSSTAHMSATESLKQVVEAWSLWRRQMTTIRSIFYYMDRSYLLHTTELPCLDDLGISLFRTTIFHDPSLREKTVEGACVLIIQARKQSSSESAEISLFKEAIGMFHALVVYTKVVQPRLLKVSEEFFDQWATEAAQNLGLAEYVQQCHGLFKSEIERCEIFDLDEPTRRSLISQMETSLVETQKTRLARKEDVKQLLKDNNCLRDHNVEALQSLYELLEMKRLGDDLEPALVEYTHEDGEAIIFDEERESEMVVRLLLFKRKLDYIGEHAFQGNPDLGHSLREAFAVFINKTKKTKSNWGTDNDKPGEMIAKYVDLILRGGIKAIPESVSALPPPANEEEIDDNDANEDAKINQQLDQVLDLFRFVNGKAVFEAFYKKDLAKRLLMNRSASADAEKSMLERLSKACGQGFTQNLETMFKDVELAREENSSYKTILEESGKRPAIDLNVNVLSAAAWPTYPTIDMVIPQAVEKAIDNFQEYYKLKHKGRTLDWKHHLAHCQMKARFPNGNKDIVVSSFQAIVMLYFNGKSDNEPVSYQELSAATKLPDVELKRTLQSLACAQYRVLSKSPKGKDVNESDKFIVNLAFSDRRTRIKINQIQLKETREENKQTHERVAQDRQYETQAAIVRIMKGSKKMNHNNLIIEVTKALRSRGNIGPDDIKKQIEKLIDKDYMERSDDPQVYEYVS